ncbi:CDP-diacylglycerol--glycerol-3-phosphate 3-phosphatidyltransferase [Oscillibacter sp. 1-3]|uniref:CDP-diacylglycerol--glycerol-3-phosphate 3-phosphatidyltransferase n=1 Tax=Oscillibacter sp. 1-3 TaxID=1235797 RepID=UPI00033F6F36|nr:CDP-diacylglycerol--glycerol-3-phosphate 3-phosphatidyltransferase [Oscillibacter sp. 1-3]EOS66856.1 CDP-diacylglycerol-glycerol-3-phosphate 3-phosphatidyltransferase [Oscillibacter sp. 1-3]MCI9511041.1 CDP-diacylglycerol--glycerol-3-phosphate 3-phosphatidyltransferase [Oscillibacter sp.]
MNLPNKLTLMRIILTPVFMAVLYWGFPGADYAALAIFIIASLTDLLDGKIARKYNLVTDFGKFADPLADKILVTAAMLWFVEVGRMPAWALLVVLLREFAVSGLRMIASDKGRVIAAGWSGKVKTAATMVCVVVMLLLGPALAAYRSGAYLTAVPWDRYISRADTVCVWVIVLTTLYSGVEYFVKNKDVIASA